MDDLEKYYSLRTIDNINLGGCGIAALSICRLMKNRGFIFPQYQIVFMYEQYEEDILDETKNKIENGLIDSIEIPTHVAVKVGDIIIDSYGVVDTKDYPLHMVVSEDQLVKTLGLRHWNSLFDRDHSVPIIEQMLGIDLSDVFDKSSKLEMEVCNV